MSEAPPPATPEQLAEGKARAVRRARVMRGRVQLLRQELERLQAERGHRFTGLVHKAEAAKDPPDGGTWRAACEACGAVAMIQPKGRAAVGSAVSEACTGARIRA